MTKEVKEIVLSSRPPIHLVAFYVGKGQYQVLDFKKEHYKGFKAILYIIKLNILKMYFKLRRFR